MGTRTFSITWEYVEKLIRAKDSGQGDKYTTYEGPGLYLVGNKY